MIEFHATLYLERIQKAIARAKRNAFAVAAFAIRATAVESIQKASGPSAPGTPPHTHNRNYLRRAIIYYADDEGAVIGPRFSAVGESARAHEFGGEFKGAQYPPRPFMLPALETNSQAFADAWRGAVQ